MQERAPKLLLVPPEPPTNVRDQRRVNRALLFSARWLINVVVVGGLEIFGLFIALMLASVVRMALKGTPMYPEWAGFLVILWMVGAIGTKALPGWGLGAVEELRRISVTLVLVFAAAFTAMFLGKIAFQFSRLTLSLAFLFSLVLIPFCRIWGKRALIHFRLWGMQAVIYADRPDTARKLIQTLKNESGLGYLPVAVCHPNAAPGETIEGLPVMRHLDEHALFASVAIIALPDRERRELIDSPRGPVALFRHTVIVPELDTAHSLWVQTRDLGGVLGLEISHNLQDPWSKGLKRISEIGMVLLSAPLWLPLMALITLLIWLTDRRNPFYVSPRIGRAGKHFSMIKFRSMRADAEELLQRELASNEELRIEWEQSFKLRQDPRVTRIGRFLRLTSLDELPQFLNILNGTMSLVGPRPLPDYHESDLPESIIHMRQEVRPGMTGLWQVSGRSDAGTPGLVKWDAYYIRNWSLWLDIVVLVRTVRVVISGRGAY